MDSWWIGQVFPSSQISVHLVRLISQNPLWDMQMHKKRTEREKKYKEGQLVGCWYFFFFGKERRQKKPTEYKKHNTNYQIEYGVNLIIPESNQQRPLMYSVRKYLSGIFLFGIVPNTEYCTSNWPKIFLYEVLIGALRGDGDWEYKTPDWGGLLTVP